MPEEKVAYVAYTGKASNVLKNKGCPNATTAHKLLYYAHQTKNGNYRFVPKKVLDDDYEVIVVDEISMLPQELWYQLLAHRVYVIASGDPFQLAPPRDETNDAILNPHIFLDEIMRQAEESAIIRLSMQIREGKNFWDFGIVPGEVAVIPHHFMLSEEAENNCLLEASQIICGTNAHRVELNARVRKLYGREGAPTEEDKVIGLKNHWDEVSAEGNALTNGALGRLIPHNHVIQDYPKNARFKDFPETDILYADFITDDGDTFKDIPIDYQALMTGTPALTGAQEYQLGGYNSSLAKRAEQYGYSYKPKIIPYNFNWGYALTGWKSQGSQYPSVLAYDAPWLKRKDPQEYLKYLYTVTTRSEEKLILVGE